MLDAVRVDLNALPPAQRPKGPAAKLIASAIEKARSACGSAPPPSCDPGPAEETAPAA